MSLFIRLAKVILLLWLRPKRLSPLDESVVRLRVWPNDLDVFGHVNNGRFLTLLDLGRFDLLMRTRLLRQGLKRGWTPVLAAAMVRFRKPLLAFAPVEMRTRLLGWDETWLYLEQTLASRGELVAAAYLRGIFLKGNARVPVAELLASIGRADQSPPLPEDLKTWLEADKTMYEKAKEGSSF